MPVSDQGIANDRYMIIPRTAVFLRRGDSYLLLKGAKSKKRWAGKYNGIGGHVERGEDVLGSAQRELHEESGMEAELWLCGTVMVDAGDTGVCIYVFTGEATGGELRGSKEGIPEWIDYERLPSLPTVEDLEVLLARIHRMQRGDRPFSARSAYNEKGKLVVTFAEPA